MRPMPLVLTVLGLAAALLPAQPEAKGPAPEQAPASVKKPLPKAIQEGYALIHSGQIEQALEHFRALVEKDPQDALSQKAVRPLAQAVQLRRLIADDKNPKWAAATQWLFTFYTTNKVPKEALALCETVWKKTPEDKAWGLKLAGCLASERMNDKALAVYLKLLEKDDDPEVQALTAVLLARMGREEDACAHLAKIPKDLEGPSLCYNIACTYALMGETAKAGHCLKRALELTPPSQIEAAKKQALADQDLSFLLDTEEMEAAQKAVSKVPEPACGSGGSCEGCPSKGKEGGCGGEKK